MIWIPGVRLLPVGLLFLFCVGCGGGGGGSSDNSPNFSDPDNLGSGTDSSAFEDTLVDCLSPGDNSTSCQLSELPLIAQKSSTVTVESVMEQTLVSHDWMAERWETVLALMPNDILQLLGSTTGVVIGADIRPSFYTTQTGAINLDAAYFWLTNEEKDDIETDPDFRSGFGDDLQFIQLARYVRENDYAWTTYSLDGDEERTLEELIEPLAALLFHELAHANDFFPKSEISSINSDNSVVVEANRLASSRISTALVDFSALQSELLEDIAEVQFFGETASESIQMLSAEEVAEEFRMDVANDDYAYSNQFEDLAMLFEEIMMQHHFDIQRDVAYTDRPDDGSLFCVDYPVRWGQRGRIGDPSVKSRASYMLQRLLNQNDVSAYMDDLPTPIAMTNGNDWCQNIVLGDLDSTSTKPQTAFDSQFPAADLISHPH